MPEKPQGEPNEELAPRCRIRYMQLAEASEEAATIRDIAGPISRRRNRHGRARALDRGAWWRRRHVAVLWNRLSIVRDGFLAAATTATAVRLTTAAAAAVDITAATTAATSMAITSASASTAMPASCVGEIRNYQQAANGDRQAE